MTDPLDIDSARYETGVSDARGFRQAYVQEGTGGVPLVCVHGWPESKRIFWKVIGPLAAAGFEVIAPDLRGFGDNDVAPAGFHDVFAHSADVYSLVHDVLGHERVVLLGGDLGGPVIQHLALRYPEWVDRMVLFNCRCRSTRNGWRTCNTPVRRARRATTSSVRASTPTRSPPSSPRRTRADGTSRGSTPRGSGLTLAGSSTQVSRPVRWAARRPSTFTPSRSRTRAKLRASFEGYRSVFDPSPRSGEALLTPNVGWCVQRRTPVGG